MATFVQKIPTPLPNYPPLGFHNFHHSGATWPSYPGPHPITAMVRGGRKHLVLTIHRMWNLGSGVLPLGERTAGDEKQRGRDNRAADSSLTRERFT